mgnify:FL=1
MHRMIWDERLSTRHAGMASDHRKMVELINRLGESMAEDSSKFTRCAIFDEIIRHTRSHFDMEDRLMVGHRYPAVEEHRSEHASLLKKLLTHKQGIEESSKDFSATLLHFLDFWWSHHIQTMDEEMAEFITASPAGVQD